MAQPVLRREQSQWAAGRDGHRGLEEMPHDRGDTLPPHPLSQPWQVLPTSPCWLVDWELLWTLCRQILQLGQHGCGMVLRLPQTEVLSQEMGWQCQLQENLGQGLLQLPAHCSAPMTPQSTRSCRSHPWLSVLAHG